MPLDPDDVFTAAVLGSVRAAIVDSRGVLIKVGRRARLFRGVLREALLVTAGRCTHRGCLSRHRLEIDHIVPSKDGGNTDADNGDPNCRWHNLQKNRGFHAYRDEEGVWHYFRPDGTEVLVDLTGAATADTAGGPVRSGVVRARWTDPRLRPVVTASITLGIATGVFAISFGVLAVAAGATVLQTCAMSLFVFTGASQLSAVSVIGAGGSFGSALGGALLLAARNGVYGLTMAGRIRGRLPTRLVAAQIVLDESTAMSSAQLDPDAQRVAFWITGTSVYVFWNIGTLIGAFAGNAIDPETFGLDGAFPAAFVAMLWPLLRTRRGRVAAALGATVCLRDDPVRAARGAAPVRHARDRRRHPRRAVGAAVVTWWTLVLALAAGAYGFKVLGLVVIGGPHAAAGRRALHRSDPGSALRCARRQGHVQRRPATCSSTHVPPASPRPSWPSWRKLPIAAVIVIGAAVTAGVRALELTRSVERRAGSGARSCASRTRPPRSSPRRPPSHHGKCSALAPREPGPAAEVDRRRG